MMRLPSFYLKHNLTRPLRAAYLCLLAGLPLTLGTVYAVHNSDSPHWGFILGTTLDFQAGRDLFTEVYIQYGIGLILLQVSLSKIIPITYTSIGVFVALIYACTLLLIYLSLELVTARSIAILVSLIALLIHPYSIYPWPDYMAGFTLAITVYILLRSPKFNPGSYIVVGLLLFVCFLFRSTYLINIAASGLLFAAGGLVHRRLRHSGIALSYAVFIFAVSTYLTILYSKGTLALWYTQAFGAASQNYGVGLRSVLGLIKDLAIPNFLQAAFFSLMLVFCASHLLLLCVKDSKVNDATATVGHRLPVMVFVSLLGITGFSQCVMVYEVFRLQNACGPLFVASAFWYHTVLPKVLPAQRYLQSQAVLVLSAAILLTNVPAQIAGKKSTTYWPLLEPSYIQGIKGQAGYLTVSSVPALADHRLPPDAASHYSGLAGVICNQNGQVINLTLDPLIPYLCGDSRNALSLPMFAEGMLRNISPPELDRVSRGDFQEGEVVVAEGVFNPAEQLLPSGIVPNPTISFRMLGEWRRPQSIRWLAQGNVVVLKVTAAH